MSNRDDVVNPPGGIVIGESRGRQVVVDSGSIIHPEIADKLDLLVVMLGASAFVDSHGLMKHQHAFCPQCLKGQSHKRRRRSHCIKCGFPGLASKSEVVEL